MMKLVDDKITTVCPLLLDHSAYEPDTIDLLNDAEAVQYWLPCLERMVKNFINKVPDLAPGDTTAIDRAKFCWKEFHDLVEKIKYNPSILKPLTVRTLLDFNEETLRKSNFNDPWKLQKEKETAAALLQYESRINQIDSIANFCSKWAEIATGLVAGNMFDWGAKAITDLLEERSGFGLAQARSKIQKRPWFVDDLDEWIERLQNKSYDKVVIFVDNAGVDFVLGILPLTRQLLLQQTRVILTANSAPAINDVTFDDLTNYLKIMADKCPVIKGALETNQLITIENGQRGPCLDLCNLNSDLCHEMRKADLLVLEGMGRAVHTNLNAKFKVDCLKIAVLKNEWLAKSLGAQQFSVIFRYDPVNV